MSSSSRKASLALSKSRRPSTNILFPRKSRPFSKQYHASKVGRNAGVRKRNGQVRDALSNDEKLTNTLANYAHANRAALAAAKPASGPFLVWHKTGHSYSKDHNGTKLGKWRNQTEYLKYLLSSQVVLEYSGYAFTFKINPLLEEKWRADDADIYTCVRKRVRKALVSAGLGDVGLAFVIEGKTKKGGTTWLHLHGLVCGIDHRHVTKFKLAMEKALEAGINRGGKGSGRDGKIELYYDGMLMGYPGGAATWSSYCAKSLMVKDERLPDQRLYMSRKICEMTKRLWGVITDMPLGKE